MTKRPYGHPESWEGRQKPAASSVYPHLFASPSRRAFSLIELIIVVAIAGLLAGLLLPSLSAVRETANRIVCSSNQRQLGMSLFMYAGDNNDALPPSKNLVPGRRWAPQELMAAHLGGNQFNFDGIGNLFFLGYCQSPDCYYCPSHMGDHALEENRDRWFRHDHGVIYTNYHYSGAYDWQTQKKRRLTEGDALVLITDGLRTARDMNHIDGINRLRGDGSVQWVLLPWAIQQFVPVSPSSTDSYDQVWDLIEKLR